VTHCPIFRRVDVLEPSWFVRGNKVVSSKDEAGGVAAVVCVILLDAVGRRRLRVEGALAVLVETSHFLCATSMSYWGRNTVRKLLIGV